MVLPIFQVDKYTWVAAGSSYLPSDMNAAYLWAQLELAQEITDVRLARWNQYNELLQPLKERGILELPTIPEGCVHNAHMYYVKTKDIEERSRLIDFLKENGIWAVFHYIVSSDMIFVSIIFLFILHRQD